MSNDETGMTVAGAGRTRRPDTGNAEGVGGHTGPHACARAIIDGTQSNDKWASAVGVWDRLRADIHKLPRDAEIAAWQLAYDALTELRADFNQRFAAPADGAGGGR